jgi:hypothetical protein
MCLCHHQGGCHAFIPELSRSRRELIQQVTPRYQAAPRAQKMQILNEYVATTGYARKYAIQLLNHPGGTKPLSQRFHFPRYGPEVQQALVIAWNAANRICAKRLIPFLPTLLDSLERHGHLHLGQEHRAQLLEWISRCLSATS